MKKFASFVLSLALAAGLVAVNVSATEAVSTRNFVVCEVKEGNCTLVDNSATNDQASGHALCFAEAYGTGRTTQGDAVFFEDVTIDKKATQVVVKCGYNLGGDKAGTGTEFWVYLNKIEGEPIAKLAVNDSETKSSQIVDQVYKYADVNVEPGTYDIIVVGETEYSGSFSQVGFIYEGGKFSETWKTDPKDYGFVNVTVKEGACELIDNSATNDQAGNNPLCFAAAYGTGRTTQGDAVKFAGVTFADTVKQLAVKCGYNLGGDKAGTATQFWVYLDKIEGEPIAKLEVSDSETKSSQIVDQVWKTADVNIKPGTYDVYVVGETIYSGSFSQVNFAYEGVNLEEAIAEKEADDAAAAEEARKKAEEEAAKKKAAEEKKKAEEAAKKAAEEEAAKKAAEEAAAAEAAAAAAAAAQQAKTNTIIWTVVAAVVVVAIIVVAVVLKKKKK